MPDSTTLTVSRHALEQFRKRWKGIKNDSFTDEQLLKVLLQVFSRAKKMKKPDTDTNADNRYFSSGELIFVTDEIRSCLITVMFTKRKKKKNK